MKWTVNLLAAEFYHQCFAIFWLNWQYFWSMIEVQMAGTLYLAYLILYVSSKMLSPEYAQCICSDTLEKTPIRENWDKLNTYLLFNFWMIKLTITPILPSCQVPTNGIFWYIGNFIIQKLKSKQLVCLSFLWWQVFLREREKIFYTYSKPKWWEFSKKMRSLKCLNS